MRRSVWPVILAGFAGSVLIGIWGREQGWTPLTIFLAQAAFLAALALVRRGVPRVFMAVLIALQALPVFGLGRVLLVAVPAFALATALMWRSYIGKFSTMEIIPRRDQAVAEGARKSVNELYHLGFVPVSSVDASGPGFETIFTYMVSSDRRTYAVVTDQVQTLVSKFGRRLLVTMDRASLPVPPSELRQVLAVDLPALVAAHDDALRAVAAVGVFPDPLEPSTIIAMARASEESSISHLTANPWKAGWAVLKGGLARRKPDADLIGTDLERIKRWAS